MFAAKTSTDSQPAHAAAERKKSLTYPACAWSAHHRPPARRIALNHQPIQRCHDGSKSALPLVDSLTGHINARPPESNCISCKPDLNHMALHDDFARKQRKTETPAAPANPRRHDNQESHQFGRRIPGIAPMPDSSMRGCIIVGRTSALTRPVYRSAVQLFVGLVLFPFLKQHHLSCSSRWQSGASRCLYAIPICMLQPRLPGVLASTESNAERILRTVSTVYHQETGTQWPPDTLYLGRTSSISDQVPPP